MQNCIRGIEKSEVKHLKIDVLLNVGKKRMEVRENHKVFEVNNHEQNCSLKNLAIFK